MRLVTLYQRYMEPPPRPPSPPPCEVAVRRRLFMTQEAGPRQTSNLQPKWTKTGLTLRIQDKQSPSSQYSTGLGGQRRRKDLHIPRGGVGVLGSVRLHNNGDESSVLDWLPAVRASWMVGPFEGVSTK